MTCSGNWAYFGITRAMGPFWWEVQEFSSFKNYLLLIWFLILCCYLNCSDGPNTHSAWSWRWADGTQVHIRPLFLPPYLQGFARSHSSSFSLRLPLHPPPWLWVCSFCPDLSELPQLHLGQVELVHREKPWRPLLGDDQALLCSLRGASWGPKRNTSVNGRV